MTREKLLYAQKQGLALFEAIETEQLIRPGITEQELCSAIGRLAAEKFGIREYWHKKIVRTGSNTLANYPDDPPDRIIAPDDILFVDLGPVVAGYEADLGRTYVLGDDPRKIKLKQDTETAWYEIRDWCRQQKSIPAARLYQLAVDKAGAYGWTFSGAIAGHIVGRFPHEQPDDPKSWALDIHPDNPDDIFLPDREGLPRHWILELQFIDPENQVGAYFEQLL